MRSLFVWQSRAIGSGWRPVWPVGKSFLRRRPGMITNDTLTNFLHCRRKAFLKAAGSSGEVPDIERVQIDLGHIYRQQALEVFLARFPQGDVVRDPPSLEAAMRSRPRVIVNATAE